MFNAHRLLLPLGLALLSACAYQPGSLTVQKQSQCPLRLHSGQQLVLILPSNPTTGFRWVVRDSAAAVLASQGPEVYSNPEDAGLVGSAGQSTWLFNARQAGEGRLLLTYQRPWEVEVAPAKSFDCAISVK
ncbi:protease inhibitor I42 family protein [Pseudomonas lalucatii]|uniref:Protease inhibitor I42 family protein n=1 Tax=Pseudomonas lalucatii TaxID=1424203 RepID=A0ABS5PZK6_9PSED|nr:protease inhibitor I42 family protein [Pseudomonas lalucatii]MBS7661518.1 protease inhibitor I42 family protein [Pseudomonas lalucatii]MBS7691851.1 protease inhibitor I42 family protein [Pseudomonas lalucatii]MBS7724037.1 protease inhibitor I42 family protein [Pseudomonas lalucatii]QVM87958.1 protease inhibitor I42 family protein [Pseudomonas lalucatii]